ncbi:MAG: hypothetical protein RIT26_2141 [Pseudomonadota bacterium]|jgi:hypothetical protein
MNILHDQSLDMLIFGGTGNLPFRNILVRHEHDPMSAGVPEPTPPD